VAQQGFTGMARASQGKCSTLGAMAVGVANRIWIIEDIVSLTNLPLVGTTDKQVYHFCYPFQIDPLPYSEPL